MGRKSKLTPAQWDQIGLRLAGGEGPSDLAREFDVHPSQITRRFAQKSQAVRNVAAKLAEAHTELAALPVRQQYEAISLSEKLRSISTSLACSAELGAKTAHRLSSLANSEVAKVDDADPLASIDKLRNVGVLTKLANDSAGIALNLLAANKEHVLALSKPGATPRTVDPSKVSTNTLRELMEARGSD